MEEEAYEKSWLKLANSIFEFLCGSIFGLDIVAAVKERSPKLPPAASITISQHLIKQGNLPQLYKHHWTKTSHHE